MFNEILPLNVWFKTVETILLQEPEKISLKSHHICHLVHCKLFQDSQKCLLQRIKSNLPFDDTAL